MKLSTVLKIGLAGVILLAGVTVGPRIVGGLILGRRDVPVDDQGQEAHASLIYGRVTTVDGAQYEGRLRWGRGEAFWGDYFNGAKKENRWAAMLAPGQLPTTLREEKVLGVFATEKVEPISTRRMFLARFGDIAKVTGTNFEVRVTLKSGETIVLDRNEASDFDDSVRVWDFRKGPVDLDSRRIQEIEFLAPEVSTATPKRLYGTLKTTKGGTFSGFVQWDRNLCLGSDELVVKASEGRMTVPFGKIRSIERRASDSLVTFTDGRSVSASGAVGAGDGNNGAYVDDARYGRVLVPWEELQRIDFSSNGSGPSYGDFARGGPLKGSVKTREGRVLAGRLVYDLDESEVTDTLDAPLRGVNYLVPFGMIASLDVSGSGNAKATLRSGEVLELERRGDLGDENGGVLVFTDGAAKPEYVQWGSVTRLDFEKP